MVFGRRALGAIITVAFSATNKEEGSSKIIASGSGGNQYIHNENSDRQYLLHQCFRQSSIDAFAMSGILEEAFTRCTKVTSNCNPAEPLDDDPPLYRVLEIGCGAGHTTLDLLVKILPDQTSITAVDTDSSMIAAAKARLDYHRQQQQHQDSSVPSKASSSAPRNNKVTFLCQPGESLAEEMPGQFDAVWLRFVTVHVPDPLALLQAAATCLKPGGILLVEDTYVPGGASSLCNPPLYAHTFFHEMHTKATNQLGGDLTRGAKIGQYMKQLGMLHDIQCNSFAPIFGGRGVHVQPWTSSSSKRDDDNKLTSLEKFDLGCRLLEQSLISLMPKLQKLNVCTQEELQYANESLSTFQDNFENGNLEDHQIFALPDGTIFQWWGRRKKYP